MAQAKERSSWFGPVRVVSFETDEWFLYKDGELEEYENTRAIKQIAEEEKEQLD